MLLVVLHIVLCVIYIGSKKQKDKVTSDTFPAVIVLMLPVFGFGMWLLDRLMVKKPLLSNKSVGYEKLKVTDAKYQRVETGQESDADYMVPLEDALIVNDSKLRRTLLLDILRKNPEEYLSILERAKASDDVEITHYATTTLLEIQGEYEKRLQSYQKQYVNGERSRDFLLEYSNCLKQYVDSQLIDGTLLTMQMENLLEVLETLLNTENSNREDAFLYIETALNLKRYEDADRVLKETIEERIESEQWNKLAVRYCWETGQREEIDKVLQAIVDSRVYLTRKGKEWFKFWSKGKVYEETTDR